MPDIEGWIGDQYIRRFDRNSLPEIQRGYEVELFSPGFQVLGSNAGGEGLFLEKIDGRIYWIPFIPLDSELKKIAFGSQNEFDKAMKEFIPAVATDNIKMGLEPHFTHPLIMGGSVEDESNRVFVPRDVHMKLCGYWNKIYHRIKSQRNNQK